MFEDRIRDLHGLGQRILKAYKEERWPRDYVVISSVVITPYADIYISETTNSKIELEAAASVQLPQINLGDPTVKFSTSSQTGKVMSFPQQENISPAFKLFGINRFMWWVWTGVMPPETVIRPARSTLRTPCSRGWTRLGHGGTSPCATWM